MMREYRSKNFKKEQSQLLNGRYEMFSREKIRPCNDADLQRQLEEFKKKGGVIKTYDPTGTLVETKMVQPENMVPNKEVVR